MEYIIGIIVALIGGVFYFKNKADSATVDSKLAKTKGRDIELENHRKIVAEAIKEIDENIEKAKAQRKQEKNNLKNMSLKERAEAAKKRYKN